jgi:predicted flavoprotein YhiN
LTEHIPKRVVDILLDPAIAVENLSAIAHRELEKIAALINAWIIKPNGTEGYRTAEVTLGGIDCDALSSKTMEVIHTKGLYFIGEVLDVTGWLGGYNFQWAWSSGWAAGQVI